MSISASLAAPMFPLRNSSSISSTPTLSALHFLPNASSTSKIQFQFQFQPTRSSTTRVFAAPEALEQTLIEDAESSTVIAGSDSEKRIQCIVDLIKNAVSYFTV
ncbi:hypothetical protein HanOQP8_Chr03g0112011 [Helianthus annuus]|nr:hypothetical protein HanLR1_Chr03g0104541 [Helianthus annuus]KAJ0774457.1 hypothetical protein HanOQP8_Chr03g0112011 [Helianthus annuus]